MDAGFPPGTCSEPGRLVSASAPCSAGEIGLLIFLTGRTNVIAARIRVCSLGEPCLKGFPFTSEARGSCVRLFAKGACVSQEGNISAICKCDTVLHKHGLTATSARGRQCRVDFTGIKANPKGGGVQIQAWTRDSPGCSGGDASKGRPGKERYKCQQGNGLITRCSKEPETAK